MHILKKVVSINISIILYIAYGDIGQIYTRTWSTERTAALVGSCKLQCTGTTSYHIEGRLSPFELTQDKQYHLCIRL